MKKESLTKKVLKYAAGGVVGAVIGMGLWITIEDEIRDCISPDTRLSMREGIIMPFVLDICYSATYSIGGVVIGGSAGFPLGLAGYHGVRKLRRRKERIYEQQ